MFSGMVCINVHRTDPSSTHEDRVDAIRGGQAASRIAELRRDLDNIIRERDTSLSILFLYGWLIDACRPPCF